MAATNDAALRELSILIRAFELVFRKLIRLLIGKISLRKIQELIRVIFVEEAEAKLKQQRPGQNVALADLALLADVDTRTIKQTRSYIALSTPLHQDVTFLSELIKEFEIEQEEAVQILNAMPESIQEIRVFLAGGRRIIETSKLEKILVFLNKYRKKE